MESETIDLFDLANQLTEVFKYQSLQNKIEVGTNFQDGLPQYVLGDLTRLTQILINLLGNAVKFTNKGKIELKIETIASVNDEVKTFRFSVIDSGIGIDIKNQERIFNAFVQEDSTITRKFGGTGLGLTISNKLLVLMNSRLQLISSFGKGSTFYFDIDLPIHNKEEKSVVIPEDTKDILPVFDKSLLKNKTVLIVDDNSVNVFLSKIMLNKILPDVKILEAKNGLEAVKMYSENLAFILMDIQMPEMDGYDATREIRKLETNNRIPIIGLTAGVLYGEKEKCLAAGMDEYISKPVVKETLEIVVRKWLVYPN